MNRCFCYVNEAITSSPQERSCWTTFTSTSDSLCPKSWDSPCSIYSTWVWSRRRSPRYSFRPVVLTLHVMKTMVWLLLHHQRPQTQHALNPLQYAYLEKMGIEDPTIYLLHRSLSHLDRGSSAMRIIFLDVSRTWRQTHRNGSRTTPSGLDHRPTGRHQYVRLGDYRSVHGGLQHRSAAGFKDFYCHSAGHSEIIFPRSLQYCSPCALRTSSTT